MPAITRFRLASSSEVTVSRRDRSRFEPLIITRYQIQVNKRSYTVFETEMGKKPTESQGFLDFSLRLAGDSLLMPIEIDKHLLASKKARLLDSLGANHLESTFFYFGAVVGTK